MIKYMMLKGKEEKHVLFIIFIFTWRRAATASVAIIAMAFVIQTGAILASSTFGQDTITYLKYIYIYSILGI